VARVVLRDHNTVAGNLPGKKILKWLKKNRRQRDADSAREISDEYFTEVKRPMNV
jgi:hypothetical protein